MTISALIKRLEQEKARRGDIDVLVDGMDIEDIAVFTSKMDNQPKLWLSAFPAD